MKNWLKSIIFFSKMYGLVHFVPLLFSSRIYKLIFAAIKNDKVIRKRLKENKKIDNNIDSNSSTNDSKQTENARIALLRLIKRKLIAVLRSTMFFSSFQHWTKLIQCWIRDILKSDAIILTVGYCLFIGTISFTFETKSRHVDYILYTSTQILLSFGRLINRLFPNFYEKFVRYTWNLTLMQLAYVSWSILQSMQGGTKYIGKLNNLAMKMVL